LNNAIAFCSAVEPSAVSAFLPPQPAAPADPVTAIPEPPRRLSSLPQAVSVAPPIAVANATVANALPILSSLTNLAF
jgi:hypothetical protein